MKNRLLGLAAFGFLLSAVIFAAAMPALADNVDQKISALEQELTRLKGEQMELKKEAVAAAAALPTFSYRPRSGITIQAADRSWSVTTFYQFHAMIFNHLDGNDRRGNASGDIFMRRNRFGWTLCVSNCFAEWHFTLDLDTGDIAEQQNSGLYFHFEQMHPWLPTLLIADEESLISWGYVTRSSTSSAVWELASDLLSDSDVDALSRRQIGIGWLGKPLGPGNYDLVFEFKPGAGVKENVTADSDRKQFVGTVGGRPFARSKNKWLERTKLGLSVAVDSVDSRSAVNGDRLRLRTTERNGRLTLFNANNIGDGTHHNIQGGLEWGAGPYLVRGELGVSRYASGKVGKADDGFKGVEGSYWRIGHELFVWSPKGLLTGGAYQPGTVQFGWAFARANATCGEHAADCDPDGAAFHRNHLIQRELNLWYYFNAYTRLGLAWNWWDAANVGTTTQVQIGCRNNNATVGGKDCDWHSVNFALQSYF